MNFHTETTLAGYARTAIHLKTRMAEYTADPVARAYLRASLPTTIVASEQDEPTDAHINGPDGAPVLHGDKVAVLAR